MLSRNSGRSTKLELGRDKSPGPSPFSIHLLLTCWIFFFPFVHNVKLLSGNLNLPKNYSLSWPHNEPPSALLVLPQLCGKEGGSGYQQPRQNMFAPGTGQGMKSFLKAPTIPKTHELSQPPPLWPFFWDQPLLSWPGNRLSDSYTWYPNSQPCYLVLPSWWWTLTAALLRKAFASW